MAKSKKNYAKVVYNASGDCFELWIKTADMDEYGFSCSTKCRALNGKTETNFIHFSFLKEVLKCIKLGYEVYEE